MYPNGQDLQAGMRAILGTARGHGWPLKREAVHIFNDNWWPWF
jgi:hypothetical protein